MTMSVGLARIIVDPTAGVLTRKALGALSTPGLLVHDTGLSIDDDGRIYIKLKLDGGLIQDEDGLYLEPEPIVVGLDSHVDLFSEDDREWNARITGSAPNFIEAGLAIGTEDFSGTFATPDADFDIPKVSITATTSQLRLAHSRQVFSQFKVFNDGQLALYALGAANASIALNSSENGIDYSGGVIINNGTTIEQVKAYTTSALFTGGGSPGVISWQEVIVSLSAVASQPVRPAQDIVTICPTSAIPSVTIAWTARITATDQVTIRLVWYDVYFGSTIDWRILIHRMEA